MITALIVDDSSYMRSSIKFYASKHGVASFSEAENGMVGVEKYKQFKPDIVFMDIMMNGMSGTEALKQIIEYDPNAKVVMVSSVLGQDPVIDEAKSLGAKAFLCKPLDDKDVAGVIGEIIKQIG